MKISESWLREWVNPDLSIQALAQQLTMAGLEVDAIEPVAGDFSGVVVAHVLSTRPHPQADRLTLCEVDPGEGPLLTVVCGASNVRPGLKVALAKIKAKLPDDLVIKETKLRGELSQGMLCSKEELGLAESSDGILELADDAPLGTDLRAYLQLDDHVLALDLTPNRADCLSVMGVARELAALNQLSLSLPHLVHITPEHADCVNVQVNAFDACPSYAGRLIKGIAPQAQTPIFIQERLRRGDIRPSHPVVDVLNYVMLALGQPMHAFDFQTLKGDLQVRYARSGETITVLNGQVCPLDEQQLVIADETQVLALAGVMGGLASAVQTDTTDVWIEAAYFEPTIIAGVARRFGLASEAAHRFERGVDPLLGTAALDWACVLLQQIAGGEIGPIQFKCRDAWAPSPKIITFRPPQVLRLTGVSIAEDTMIDRLTRLGMAVEQLSSHWAIHIPTHRFDLHIEADLIEEVIRMVGYDHIPTQTIATEMRPGQFEPSEQLSTQILTFLAHRGYQETISYSFVDPELQQTLYPDARAKSLLNPISSELADMRIGLWPGLLASMIRNIHRQQPALKLMEIGKVFFVADDATSVTESVCCAGLITGEYGQFNWSERSAHYDFFDMKGDLQTLFAALYHDDVMFAPGEHAALHPGKTAQIMHAGQRIGWLGVIHPRLVNALDLDQDIIVFEFQLASLTMAPRSVYQPISKYPYIRRDLSLLLDESIRAQQVEQVVRQALDPCFLKTFYVFDVYTGGGLMDMGKKSMAVGVVLQSENRTLQDEEIQTMMNTVIQALEQQLNAVLRSDKAAAT